MKKIRHPRLWFYSLGFIFLFVWFTYSYVPSFIVEIKNPVIELGKTFFYEVPVFQDSGQKKLQIITRDGWRLKADVYLTKHPKATIILLHGIRSSKEQWQTVASWLNKKGYNAVALDLRGHGESEGQYTTFGYLEKKDVSILMDSLTNRGIKKPFGIWGHSLGGAIALQTLAVDKRLQFGIIESSYADFDQITKDYAQYYLHFELDDFQEWLNKRAGALAGFPVDKVNPADYTPEIYQPILIIHGTADPKIKPENARILYRTLSSKQKEIVWVRGAKHTDIHQVGGTNLFNKIDIFIKKTLDLSKLRDTIVTKPL